MSNPITRVRQRLEKRSREAEVSRYLKKNPRVAEVIGRVKSERLTFLGQTPLVGLASTMTELERRGVQGAVLEAGTALGGSTIVLAAAKSPERRLLAYDTFGLIPPPSDKDGADVHKRYETIASGKSKGFKGDTYYGYREDLLGEIRASFERIGYPVEDNAVEFVQGVYQDTLHPDFPVALAHVDCDWYESVMTCLERIHPHLVDGGRFVIDDYYAWSGARTAVDEWVGRDLGYRLEKRFGRVHLVKG
jgi:hypothetical protein